MSDKRLLELGIPRRGFLKKTATAAFVAPVVASFGLDGIAEAGPGSFSNQGTHCFSNQFYSNQTFGQVENNLMSMLDEILTALNYRHVDAGLANGLAEHVLRVLLEVADGQPSSACETLQHLDNELHDRQAKLPVNLYNGLLTNAQAVQSTLGCVCS